MAGSADKDLPFDRYERGGRTLLGRPRQGDVTARHGYGPPVFEQCGYKCVYCGLDMVATFGNWLQVSIDHVIPRQMARAPHNYPMDWVEDITNLVTCCRACNDFGNHYTVSGPKPATEADFFEMRDRVFLERRANILVAREKERLDHFVKFASGRASDGQTR